MSYQRSIEDERRLKKLYDETKNSYYAGAYIDPRKGYYRYSVQDGDYAKWLKKYSNRYIRRKLSTSDIIYSRRGDKKLREYKWELL